MKKLTTEELLKQLEEKQEDTKILKNNNDVFNFVSFYWIREGKEKVTPDALYFLYKNWSKKPFNKFIFESELKKYIPKDKLFYYINLKTINLTEKAYSIINEKVKPKEKNRKYKEHFESFLNTYNILGGTSWIKDELLFDLYSTWLKNNRKKLHLNKINFKRFLKLYFKEKNNENYSWYGINLQESEICVRKQKEKKHNIQK